MQYYSFRIAKQSKALLQFSIFLTNFANKKQLDGFTDLCIWASSFKKGFAEN